MHPLLCRGGSGVPWSLRCHPLPSAATSQLLVKGGADTEVRNDAGLRPIDVARVLEEHPRAPEDKGPMQEIIRILERFAHRNDRTDAGLPLHKAVKERRPATVQVRLRAGCSQPRLEKGGWDWEDTGCPG